MGHWKSLEPHTLPAHKCTHVQPTCSCYPTSEQMHLRNRQCRLLPHTCAPDLPRSPPSDQANLNLSMSLNKVERVGYQRVGSFWTLAIFVIDGLLFCAWASESHLNRVGQTNAAKRVPSLCSFFLFSHEEHTINLLDFRECKVHGYRS